MLYVFVGDDVIEVRARAHRFLEKHTSDDYERVTSESYAEGILESAVEGLSLFGDAPPVMLDFLSGDEGAFLRMIELAPAFEASSRVFVMMDEKLGAEDARTFKRHAAEYQEYKAGDKKERFNTFALADAFLRKDKKSLWVLLQRARAADVSPEEVAGVLFWQIKTLRLALSSKNMSESGLKEFPYKKAKGASKNFSLPELERLSGEILMVYHDGHAFSDMELGLERFALTM